VLRCTQKNPRTWYVKAPTSTTLLKPAAYYCEKWHAYNLIRPSDLLTASAIRRVTTELSSTGSTSSQRVHTNLTIRVKSLDFDPQAGQLHVSGQIARENRYTKIGQFHTLDLELQRNFTLEKEVEGAHGGEGWDSIARAQLADATDSNKGTEAVAVVMQEGLANICFITQYQTVLRQRVEVSVPRKRAGAGRSADHDKGLQKFFGTVLETLLRQLEGLLEGKDDKSNMPILLASPGFTAAGFLKYANEAATNKGDKLLQDLVKRKAFILIHSSSGHLHSLNEVLKSPEVLVRLKDTKYARETALMDDFFTLLRKDDGRAWYGPKECEMAVEKGAVGRGGGILIISNALFRSQDVATRRHWVRLVDRVREVEGGEVRVLSSDHESGSRLESLGGIAAILTFPIEEMEVSDEEESIENGDAPSAPT
jgi:protein pelota